MSGAREAEGLHRPIFLLGAHKSGTSLLRSLLDGTPGLAILPKESHLFQFTGYWVDYALRRSLPRMETGQELRDRIIGRLAEMNAARNPYSDFAEFSGFDLDIVRRRMQESGDASPARGASTYLRALYEAWAGDPLPSGARLVEKSVEHAEYAVALQNFFPDCSFVHIVRDPHATLVAVRRAKGGEAYPYMGPIARSLYNSYYYLFKNRDLLGSYHVIRYEDLLRSPRTVMSEVADRLDIPMHAGLLEPTAAGRPWAGNSTSGVAFHGLSAAPLDAWKAEITPYEVELVRRIGRPVLEQYGYEPPAGVHGRVAKRHEREGLRTWILNRALLETFGMGE